MCSEACGYCGRCTAAYEREDENIEVCPNCLGTGEVVREDGIDAQVVATCLECNGAGSIAV